MFSLFCKKCLVCTTVCCIAMFDILRNLSS